MRAMIAALPTERHQWRDEAVALVRAASGGFLFGIPLLYTMEVWWTAEHTTAGQALVVLGLTVLPVIALNRTAGFRKSRAATWRDAFLDAVEAMGVAAVVAFVVLVLLREIRGATPPDLAVQKVVYQVLPFSIGVGVAAHFFREGRDDEGGDGEGGDGEGADGEGGGGDGEGDGAGHGGRDGGGKDEGPLHGTVADISATLIGSAFIALNIAPTEEVPMLASAMGPHWQMALVVFSLLVTYAIVFVAGFSGQRKRREQKGVLQRPLSETAAAYLVSLGSAALMLTVFQQMSGPFMWQLGQTIVLGLPAAVGGAAGRLAI